MKRHMIRRDAETFFFGTFCFPQVPPAPLRVYLTPVCKDGNNSPIPKLMTQIWTLVTQSHNPRYLVGHLQGRSRPCVELPMPSLFAVFRRGGTCEECDTVYRVALTPPFFRRDSVSVAHIYCLVAPSPVQSASPHFDTFIPGLEAVHSFVTSCIHHKSKYPLLQQPLPEVFTFRFYLLGPRHISTHFLQSLLVQDGPFAAFPLCILAHLPFPINQNTSEAFCARASHLNRGPIHTLHRPARHSLLRNVLCNEVCAISKRRKGCSPNRRSQSQASQQSPIPTGPARTATSSGPHTSQKTISSLNSPASHHRGHEYSALVHSRATLTLSKRKPKKSFRH
jgi:hypothetical protein